MENQFAPIINRPFNLSFKILFFIFRTLIPIIKEIPKNIFNCSEISIPDISIKNENNKKIRVIKTIDGQLITEIKISDPLIKDGYLISDTENDILKIVVVNRYENGVKPSIGFINGFALKQGANIRYFFQRELCSC